MTSLVPVALALAVWIVGNAAVVAVLSVRRRHGSAVIRDPRYLSLVPPEGDPPASVRLLGTRQHRSFG